MPAPDLSRVHAAAELEALEVEFSVAGDHELRFSCPVHDDAHPSAYIDTRTNRWGCRAASCGASGDVANLISFITHTDRKKVLAGLEQRYNIEKAARQVVTEATIERWRAALPSSGPFLAELRARGVTDEVAALGRLGFDGKRITIPIWDERDRVVDVKRYLPGAHGAMKMVHQRGSGGARLHPLAQLEFDRVWVCAGELKALVVAHLLNPHGWGAVSGTGGEDTWIGDWSPKFAGKEVLVCYDIDAGGRRGAQKVARALRAHARRVAIVALPLDADSYPSGDISDYVGREGAGSQELLDLASGARDYEDPTDIVDDREVREVALSRITDAELVGWPIQTIGLLAAVDRTPYLVPREVRVACDRSQPGCGECPIAGTEFDPDESGVLREIPAHHPANLEFLHALKARQPMVIREGLGIPGSHRCKSASLTVASYRSLRDARLAPRLEIHRELADGDVMTPAYVVGDDCEISLPYELSGRVWPSPKNQQATMLVTGVERTEDSLDTFAPSAEDLEALDHFRPESWSADEIDFRLMLLHDQIERHVTRIYGRRDLHLALDLAWHCPLHLKLRGRPVRGWFNLLILGDSAQGKSEAAIQYCDFLGLGERVDCKNASRAGLIGGLQQLGGKWFVTWGRIPTHDRRLVFLDELKGLPTDVVGSLTDMRSSGVAELAKIERRRTYARTRLVMVSNPRAARPLGAYPYGVEAVVELLGSLEDVRRIDLALFLGADDLDRGFVTEQSSQPLPKEEDAPSADLHRRLVLWAWTLGESDVLISQDVEAAVLREARGLVDDYSESVPLIDAGSAREKVLRVAAALAARTFSSDETRRRLVIREGHVSLAARTMRRFYDAPACGYRDFSQVDRSTARVKRPNELAQAIKHQPHWEDLVEGLLAATTITVADLRDWMDAGEERARALVSTLVRSYAMRRTSTFGEYEKTPDFVRLLKSLAARQQDLEDSQETF